MSQNNHFPSIDETSSFDDDGVENNVILSPDALSYSNDDWKSVDDNNDIDINQIQDDLTVINNNGWANFDTLENNANRTIEVNESFQLTVLFILLL